MLCATELQAIGRMSFFPCENNHRLCLPLTVVLRQPLLAKSIFHVCLNEENKMLPELFSSFACGCYAHMGSTTLHYDYEKQIASSLSSNMSMVLLKLERYVEDATTKVSAYAFGLGCKTLRKQ